MGPQIKKLPCLKKKFSECWTKQFNQAFTNVCWRHFQCEWGTLLFFCDSCVVVRHSRISCVKLGLHIISLQERISRSDFCWVIQTRPKSNSGANKPWLVTIWVWSVFLKPWMLKTRLIRPGRFVSRRYCQGAHRLKWVLNSKILEL